MFAGLLGGFDEVLAPRPTARARLTDAMGRFDEDQCLEIIAESMNAESMDAESVAAPIGSMIIRGLPVLHAAASRNLARVVEALVDAGVSPEERLTAGGIIFTVGCKGDSALHTAVRRGSQEAAVALVRVGADLEAKDAHGRTSLELADAPLRRLLLSSFPKAAVLTAAATTTAATMAPLTTAQTTTTTAATTAPATTTATATTPVTTPVTATTTPVTTPATPPATPPATTPVTSQTSVVGVEESKGAAPDKEAGESEATRVAMLLEENRSLRERLKELEVSNTVTTPLRRKGPAWAEAQQARSANMSPRRRQVARIVDDVSPNCRGVLEACAETAQAYASPSQKWDSNLDFFRSLIKCPETDAAQDALISRFTADEDLIRARALGCGVAGPRDGSSVLHALAEKGKKTLLRKLLTLENDKDKIFFSSWVLDPQGRTPLHVAAEMGHVECVSMLKAAMALERGGEVPVGVNAPGDLCGRTPVAWASVSKSVKTQELRDQLETHLFARGDSTVLPINTVREQTPQKRYEDGLVHVVSGTAGWRVNDEDAYCCESPFKGDSSLFCVFDGHGGDLVSSLAAAEFPKHLRDLEPTAESLQIALIALDSELRIHPALKPSRWYMKRGKEIFIAEDTSGSTALVTLVTSTHLHIANLGDSRAALCWPSADGWQGEMLTREHKPGEASERERIEQCGASVEPGPPARVKMEGDDMQIACSRSLGDFKFKPNVDAPNPISNIAELLTRPLAEIPKGAILVVACDGLWDVLNELKTAEILGKALDNSPAWSASSQPAPSQSSRTEALSLAGEAVISECVELRSRDNVTVVLVELPREPRKTTSNDPRALLFPPPSSEEHDLETTTP